MALFGKDKTGTANIEVDDEAALYGYFANFMVQKDALHAEIAKAKDRMRKNLIGLADAGTSRDEGGHDPASGFLDLFEAELNRVSETVSSQQESQELSAKAFLTNVEAIVEGETNPEVFLSLRDKAGDIADMSLKLQRFVKKNADILRETAEFADSEINVGSSMILNRRLTVSPWKEGPNSALVVVLSDIYSVIRDAETKDKEKAGTWVAPSSFERSTTKYWIQEDKLTELLLANVTEAPLLVYGKSGNLTKKSELTYAEGDKLWDTLATSISSVYFDSPTMCMYKERIKRSEGAQLFRVRWYGAKPSGNGLVFLELKTHHEKWINEKSVKERCTIREKDMRRFLSSQNWSKEVAEELCLGGTPTLAGEELEKQMDLCQRMHDVVIKNDLRPCVRSMYVRAAFQSANSNSLRLTLDRNVTLIDETRAPRGSWCLPDDAVISADMVSQVPYPVFEVKLSGSDMPAILQDLEARGIMIEAPKFSKFLTGAASFNSDKLESLPYWAENAAFQEIFGSKKQEAPLPAGKRIPSGLSLRKMKQTVDSCSIADINKVSELFLEPIDESNATALSTESNVLRKRKTGKSELRTSGNSASSGAAPKHAVRPMRPARVEPKSFFANERTFIQWLSSALMMVTISSILIQDLGADTGVPMTAGIVMNSVAIFIILYAMFAYYRRVKKLESGSPYGYIDHVGPFILALSFLLSIIMLLYYYIVIAMQTNAAAAASTVLTAESGLCFQHPLSGGTRLMQYQPSDVVVDVETNTLLVPSLQTITGVNVTHPESAMQTLITVPGTDFEAITFAGDRLFAVSEGGNEPVLYELMKVEWRNTPMLVEINSWNLDFGQSISNGMSEAITYVPDSMGGSLYIAGDELDPLNPDPASRGAIYIFDIPAVGDEEPILTRRDMLNSNLLNAGSQDSKIGALHYFEGVLYVLNDNDRSIRSWNLNTGELLATTPVPRVQSEFTQQWEGLFLEHRNENNGRLGRQLQGGGSNSSLIVHMALDTPPQVWSFAVDQMDGVPGSLIFPECAAAM